MTNVVTLEKALSISFLDVHSLSQGHTITIISEILIPKDWQFLLYPYVPESLTFQEYKYFPQLAQPDLPNPDPEPTHVEIQFYAVCEQEQMLQTPDEVQNFCQKQGWSFPAAMTRFQVYNNLLVPTFRVYQLAQGLRVPSTQTIALNPKRRGKFISLGELGLKGAIHDLGDRPILSDQQFLDKKLGDRWVSDIVPLGDRSIEQEPKVGSKSNYQAGTDFENIVKKSLEFLGFTIDSSHKGGAGGLDFYCSAPYPIIGECKAGKTIPSGTVEEILKLGGMHKGINSLQENVKLIIGPGKPTPDLLTAAHHWNVSIMNPQTLQDLVDLQAKFPHCINPWELKKSLQAGDSNQSIQTYIQHVKQALELRLAIVDLVKTYLEKSKTETATLDSIHTAYILSDLNQQNPLSKENLDAILSELASPLVGYLGCRGDSTGRSGFYILKH